jgi:hypothetical protein
MKAPFSFLALLVFFSGCGVLPSNKTSTKQMQEAGRAVTDIADSAFASMAERIGSKMAASTSHERNAELAAEMASIEKARRKLNPLPPKT